MNDTIFKSNTCPSCIVVENAIRNSRLPIAIANIDTSADARTQFDRLGSRAVPTAVIDGRVYIGAPIILSALRSKYGRV